MCETICCPKFALAKFGIPVVFMKRGTSEIKNSWALRPTIFSGSLLYLCGFKLFCQISVMAVNSCRRIVAQNPVLCHQGSNHCLGIFIK